MFGGCSSLKDISSLENWNVSKVKYFQGMFNRCKELSNLGALRHWNVSNGLNFSCMFCDCRVNNTVSLIEWKVKTESNFEKMFEGCFLDDLNNLKNWCLSEEKIKSMKKIKDTSYTYSQSNKNFVGNNDDSDDYEEKPKIRKKFRKKKRIEY